MLELLLRPNAKRDLAGIWRYTCKKWSRAQADRYLSSLTAEIERLRRAPSLGRPVSNVQAPFLSRSCGSHVIFFLIEGDRLDVVRILHAQMDFVAHLAGDDS
jgi:toxin ParE1/3/4